MMGEVDVYHVNHHGSKSATNEKWSKTLKPTVSVFSCGKNSGAGHPAAGPLKNLNSVGSEMYLTNNCNSNNTNKYGKKIHIMNGDVVITVPKDGTQFKVAKADGSSATKYNIKANKPARAACKQLGEEPGFFEEDSDSDLEEEEPIFVDEDIDVGVDKEDPELSDDGEDDLDLEEDEGPETDDETDDDIVVEGEPEIAEEDDERALFEEGYGEPNVEF